MNPILILMLLITALVVISILRRRPDLLLHPAVRAAAIGLVTLALIYLGTRLHWSVMFLAPLLPHLWMRWGRARAARGPTRGSTSKIETPWLRMTIDHDTGRMSGEVLRGVYRSRTLESLHRPELLSLLGELRRNDDDSARLLETYLDRAWEEGWRDSDPGARSEHSERTQGDSGVEAGTMTKSQALEILGLEPGAKADAIVSAHRRLIQKLHPDRGGSSYLAAQINRAKDVLLG